MNQTNKPGNTISVDEACALLKKGKTFIHEGLRKKEFSWGDAVETTPGHFEYVIYTHALSLKIGRWWEQ